MYGNDYPTLKVPKLRTLTFETAIIQRYQKREISVGSAGGDVPGRRFGTQSRGYYRGIVGFPGLGGTVSELNKKVYVRIEEWRQRPLQGKYPYVYLDGIYLKRNWGGEYENVAVLVAMAVNQDGYREVIGAAEGMKEDKESWLSFLKSLKQRGLNGTQLFIGDKCLGLLEAVHETFPASKFQRCTVHFYRNVFSVTPRSKVKLVAACSKQSTPRRTRPTPWRRQGLWSESCGK